MLYVQQSLNPDEEIVHVGHFHWMYTFSAMMWVVMGAAVMLGILYGTYFFEVFKTMQTQFRGLPDHLYDRAWSEVAAAKGGMLTIIQSQHIGIKIGACVALLFGIFVFIQKMIIKATTEICLTTDRIILKRGLVARHIEEIAVGSIEGVEVRQGILGRMLNYGMVCVRGMGVGNVALPPIEDPVGFRRSIDRARELKKGGGAL